MRVFLERDLGMGVQVLVDAVRPGVHGVDVAYDFGLQGHRGQGGEGGQGAQRQSRARRAKGRDKDGSFGMVDDPASLAQAYLPDKCGNW